MNVVPFSDYESDRQAQAHQLGLPRVVLEGPSDVRLFLEWFEHLNEDLEFIEASRLGNNGGGCTAVAPAVSHSRDTDGIPAVGIVDRDSLHRDHRWELVFATDDEVFAREARTEAVYTTTLWEVEAYLLRPELLAGWVATQSKQLPASAAARAAALVKTLEECEALLRSAPLFAASHASGSALADAHFSNLEHHQLAEACEHHTAAQSQQHRDLSAQIEPLIDAIMALAPVDTAERLLFLLRYVDTKRLLVRLKKRLRLRDEAHWGLTTLMSGAAMRPEELETFLLSTAERYAA